MVVPPMMVSSLIGGSMRGVPRTQCPLAIASESLIPRLEGFQLFLTSERSQDASRPGTILRDDEFPEDAKASACPRPTAEGESRHTKHLSAAPAVPPASKPND